VILVRFFDKGRWYGFCERHDGRVSKQRPGGWKPWAVVSQPAELQGPTGVG